MIWSNNDWIIFFLFPTPQDFITWLCYYFSGNKCLVCIFRCLSETGNTLMRKSLHTLRKPLNSSQRFTLPKSPDNCQRVCFAVLPGFYRMTMSKSVPILSLSFFVCETIGSMRRMPKKCPVLKCDNADDVNERQVHSESLNGRLRRQKNIFLKMSADRCLRSLFLHSESLWLPNLCWNP